MTATQGELLEFLGSRGARQVDHTGRALLDHLISVRDMLASYGCAEWVCRAGLFHSVYGTDSLEQAIVSSDEERPFIRMLIGADAEALVYLFSRASSVSFALSVLGRTTPWLADRRTGDALAVSTDEFTALMWVHLVNALEQLPRAQKEPVWSDQVLLRRLGERLGVDIPPVTELVAPTNSEASHPPAKRAFPS